MSLPVALLVVPLRTLTAGNGARAHGARAKAGTQYFFLSFWWCQHRRCTMLSSRLNGTSGLKLWTDRRHQSRTASYTTGSIKQPRARCHTAALWQTPQRHTLSLPNRPSQLTDPSVCRQPAQQTPDMPHLGCWISSSSCASSHGYYWLRLTHSSSEAAHYAWPSRSSPDALAAQHQPASLAFTGPAYTSDSAQRLEAAHCTGPADAAAVHCTGPAGGHAAMRSRWPRPCS
jgi:hypothetical protein